MQVKQLGLEISEKEYRGLDYPSYSLLSAISKVGPLALYGVKEDISDLDSIIIGKITDSLVTEGVDPEGMTIVDKKPSNKALKVIKDLCSRDDLPNKGSVLVVKNLKEIKEACDAADYYSSSSDLKRLDYLKKYNKYTKALATYGEDIFIVSNYQYSTGVRLTNTIKSKFPFVTGDDIVAQVQLVGEINGISLKGMLDFIHIDDINKTITPYDLKTGIGNHYSFFETGYLNWNYFIQASLYKELLIKSIIGTKYEDYKILSFKFLYCGRSDFLPIIYTVTDKWHEAGLKGFTYENKEYKGVYELIKEFEYYKQHPNSFYKKGFNEKEILFDDSLCKINQNG